MTLFNFSQFYKQPLGQKIHSNIQKKITSLWQENIEGKRVLGLGYAQPYLGFARNKAESMALFCLTHHYNGLGAYPENAPNSVAVIEETLIPLRDQSVDRILCIHGLEHSESSEVFMLEISRILAPQGECLLLIPNRRGLWARTEHTPFGHGKPYTYKQIFTLIQKSHLSALEIYPHLLFPPFTSEFLLKTTPFCDFIGKYLFAPYCGAFLLRIRKQIYVPNSQKRLQMRHLITPALGSIHGCLKKTKQKLV